MTIDLLLKSCLVLVVATVVVKAMARSSAASRHLVWTGAFAALLALPIARGVVPDLPLRVLPAAPGETAVWTTIATPDAPTSSETAPTTTFSAAAGTEAPAPMFRRWSRAVAGDLLWFGSLTGSLVLLLRAGLGVLLLRGLSRRATPVVDPWILSRVDACRTQLRLSRPVRVLLAPDEHMPATWGAFRSTLLLPASAPSWRDSHPDRLDLVLMHELSHVVRRDALARLIATVAVSVFWVNPFVFLAGRRARLEGERACDDVVLAGGAPPSSYAAELMALLRVMTSAAPPALAMARESQIERRIDAILDVGVNRRGVSHASAAVFALLVLLGVPVATVRLAARVETNPPVERLTTTPALVPAPLARAETYEPILIVRPEATQLVGTAVARSVPSATIASAPPEQNPQLAVSTAQAPADESWPQFRARTLEMVRQRAESLLRDARRKVEIGTLSFYDTPVFQQTLDEVARAMESPAPSSPADLPAIRMRFDESMRLLDSEQIRFNVGLATGTRVCSALLDAVWVIAPRPVLAKPDAAIGQRLSPIRIPIGYAPVNGPAGLWLRSPKIDGPGFRVEVTNIGASRIESITFAALVERIPQVGPITVMQSPALNIALDPGASTQVNSAWLDENAVSLLLDPASRQTQAFITPALVRYAGAAEWRVELHPEATNVIAALGAPNPSVSRSLISPAGGPAGAVGMLCLNDEGKTFSQGIVLGIRGEANGAASCQGGRWVEPIP